MDPARRARTHAAGGDARGVFAPARFLDLIRNFVLVRDRRCARRYKVMAKYHQVHAVNRAVEATAAGDARGRPRRAWSGTRRDQARATRWSSSSRSCAAIRASRTRRSSCVTDRTDLDDQLDEQLQRQRHLAPPSSRPTRSPAARRACMRCSKAARPAGSSSRRSRSSGRRTGRAADAGPLGAREHHRHRRRGAPHASTTTLRAEHHARAAERDPDRLHRHADREGRPLHQLVFGDYISSTGCAARRQDGATVPIYYESRQVPLDVDDPRSWPRSRQVARDGGGRGAQTSSSPPGRSWRQVVGARTSGSRRSPTIIAEHFSDALRGAGGQGDGRRVLSRRIAARLTELLQERLGEEAVDLRDLRARDRPAGAVEVSALEAEAEAGSTTDFKDPDHPRCGSWSCATCG